MGTVAKFPPKVSGEAKCVGCGHVWMADRYDDSRVFECPECGAVKATHRHYHRPDEDTRVWTCARCEGDLYIIMSYGVMCINCGQVTTYNDLLE